MQSSRAWNVFAVTVGGLICIAVAVPYLMGSSWMWRLQRDGLRRGEPHFFGLFSPHKPVRFDMHHVSDQARRDLCNRCNRCNRRLADVSDRAAVTAVTDA